MIESDFHEDHLRERYLLKYRPAMSAGGFCYYMVFRWLDGVPVYIGLLLENGSFVSTAKI